MTVQKQDQNSIATPVASPDVGHKALKAQTHQLNPESQMDNIDEQGRPLDREEKNMKEEFNSGSKRNRICEDKMPASSHQSSPYNLRSHNASPKKNSQHQIREVSNFNQDADIDQQ